jgi:hypothetical protein
MTSTISIHISMQALSKHTQLHLNTYLNLVQTNGILAILDLFVNIMIYNDNTNIIIIHIHIGHHL